VSARSTIEWTDASWTPIRARRHDIPGHQALGWHCQHVSEGCRNCYAEALNKRIGTGLDFKPGNRDLIELFLDEKMLLDPVCWRNPRMIFVCSMTDIFSDFVKDEWIDRMFAVMALCPRHVFQVLTKRSERMLEYLTSANGKKLGIPQSVAERRDHICVECFNINEQLSDPHIKMFLDKGWIVNRWPLPNVWLGVSCEDQETAYTRIPDLLATPAAVRFVSCEPMLGEIDLRGLFKSCPAHDYEGGFCIQDCGNWNRLDWVICGGESGHTARPMHPAWARSLRDQCASASVPFFMKQMRVDGKLVKDLERFPAELRIREFPNAAVH